MWPRLALIASLALPIAGAQPPQTPSQTAPPSPQEVQRQRAAERMRALQAEAEALAGREKTLLVELRRFEVERDLRAAEVQRLEAETGALEGEISGTSSQLSTLEESLARQQPALAARLVETYKLGRPGYARLWFAADDLRALGRAIRLVSALAEIDRYRIEDYRATLAKLSAARTDLDRRLSAAAALRDEARQARAAAEAAASAHAALIADIDLRRDLNAQMVGELREAQARLQDTVSSLAGRDPARPGGGQPVILPLRPFKGELDWPVQGAILTAFGPRVHPRFGTTTVSTGIEIAAAQGAPARAVHDGTVAFAETYAAFGLLVILDHGGQSYSLYGHLDTHAVALGDHVAAGQAVGTIGRGPTGKPSLYFELRIDGEPVDPVQWLRSRSGV